MNRRREVDDPGAVAGACFNMTPMIDVTFQLIVVFLCSMKFRTLDQKIEAFLPKDVGICDRWSPVDQASRIDLRLRRRPGAGTTEVLLLGGRLGPADDDGFWPRFRDRVRSIRERDPRMDGEIHADPDVPHSDVVAALDSFRAAGVDKVIFRGTPPPRATLPPPREAAR